VQLSYFNEMKRTESGSRDSVFNRCRELKPQTPSAAFKQPILPASFDHASNAKGLTSLKRSGTIVIDAVPNSSTIHTSQPADFQTPRDAYNVRALMDLKRTIVTENLAGKSKKPTTIDRLSGALDSANAK
jgi:hypothetical protein